MRPKTPRPPPIAAPAAIPLVGIETREQAIKKARRGSGFERTLLTGALRPKQDTRLLRGTTDLG